MRWEVFYLLWDLSYAMVRFRILNILLNQIFWYVRDVFFISFATYILEISCLCFLDNIRIRHSQPRNCSALPLQMIYPYDTPKPEIVLSSIILCSMVNTMIALSSILPWTQTHSIQNSLICSTRPFFYFLYISATCRLQIDNSYRCWASLGNSPLLDFSSFPFLNTIELCWAFLEYFILHRIPGQNLPPISYFDSIDVIARQNLNCNVRCLTLLSVIYEIICWAHGATK